MARKTVQETISAELKLRLPVAFAGMLAVYAPTAFCYVGPGAGLGMLASLFAMLLVVIATIVGLVLWPIRMLSRRKQPSPDAKEASTPDGSA